MFLTVLKFDKPNGGSTQLFVENCRTVMNSPETLGIHGDSDIGTSRFPRFRNYLTCLLCFLCSRSCKELEPGQEGRGQPKETTKADLRALWGLRGLTGVHEGLAALVALELRTRSNTSPYGNFPLKEYLWPQLPTVSSS